MTGKGAFRAKAFSRIRWKRKGGMCGLKSTGREPFCAAAWVKICGRETSGRRRSPAGRGRIETAHRRRWKPRRDRNNGVVDDWRRGQRRGLELHFPCGDAEVTGRGSKRMPVGNILMGAWCGRRVRTDLNRDEVSQLRACRDMGRVDGNRKDCLRGRSRKARDRNKKLCVPFPGTAPGRCGPGRIETWRA